MNGSLSEVPERTGVRIALLTRPTGKSTESVWLVSIKGHLVSSWSARCLLYISSSLLFLNSSLSPSSSLSEGEARRIRSPPLAPVNLHVYTSVHPSNPRKNNKNCASVDLSDPATLKRSSKQNMEQHRGKESSLSQEPRRAAAVSLLSGPPPAGSRPGPSQTTSYQPNFEEGKKE